MPNGCSGSTNNGICYLVSLNVPNGIFCFCFFLCVAKVRLQISWEKFIEYTHKLTEKTKLKPFSETEKMLETEKAWKRNAYYYISLSLKSAYSMLVFELMTSLWILTIRIESQWVYRFIFIYSFIFRETVFRYFCSNIG